MRASRLPALLALSAALLASAQTYTPKAIRLQGADGLDQAELMRLVDLHPGASISKDQIDAALQRLGGSGLFSEIRYTVDPDALVFLLKPAPGSQALAVRFTNFVWWKPEELESLVEARVPLYRGKLPLTGQLTDQVEAALVAILAEKGIHNAQVSARLSTFSSTPGAGPVNALAISLDQPQIMLRKIQLTGTAPEVAAQMHNVLDRLTGQEFDSVLTLKQIVDNTVDTHRNGGFLDVTVTDPFFSEPFLETVGYGINASAVVYPGARYRVSAVTFDGVPTALQSTVQKAIQNASGIEVGDPAGQMALRIAEASAARVLKDRGMLDTTVSSMLTKDTAAHTVAYRLDIVPGSIYTFAGVDISALSPAQRVIFQHTFHTKPGVVADESVRNDCMLGLRAAGAHRAVLEERKDRAAHAVNFIIQTQPPATASLN